MAGQSGSSDAGSKEKMAQGMDKSGKDPNAPLRPEGGGSGKSGGGSGGSGSDDVSKGMSQSGAGQKGGGKP